MKKVLFTLAILNLSFYAIGQKEYISEEIQINMASMAAPEEDREAVRVYGYDRQGKTVLMKEGTNNLVCIADDPNMSGISVSCYNKKLDPFMSRGRELKAQGKDMMETRAIRKQEVESGNLKMPDAPSMTYVLTGKEANLNRETGELKDGKLRYVIYIPYATTQETGLPNKPHAPGMPWLMDPGTHRAHIMITPVDKNP
jgi:hypothetical protein